MAIRKHSDQPRGKWHLKWQWPISSTLYTMRLLRTQVSASVPQVTALPIGFEPDTGQLNLNCTLFSR